MGPNTRRVSLSIAVLCLLVSGVRAASKEIKALEEFGREILGDTSEGRKIIAEFDRYAKIAHILRKQHDSAHLDDKEVLDILRQAGVLPAPPAGAPRPRSARTPTPPAKPYPVAKYEGRYRWPLAAGIVSSEFGTRWGKRHEGLDLAASMGVPVFTAAPGEIIYASNGLTGYGNVVIVRHDDRTTSLYGHNRKLLVRQGQKVKRNQAIAELGSTGRSTGPHVHFEFRVGGKAVAPRTLLPKSRF